MEPPALVGLRSCQQGLQRYGWCLAMLTYSSRTSAALRAHLDRNSTFGHEDSRPPRIPVLLSMESRFALEGEEWHKKRAQALCGDDTGGIIDQAVEIVPSDAVTRRAASWDGMAVEAIQLVARDTVEFRFRAPTHLLVAYEEG